jgi:hypothetical protein
VAHPGNPQEWPIRCRAGIRPHGVDVGPLGPSTLCIEASVCLVRIDLRLDLTLVVFKIRLPRVHLRRSLLPPSGCIFVVVVSTRILVAVESSELEE